MKVTIEEKEIIEKLGFKDVNEFVKWFSGATDEELVEKVKKENKLLSSEEALVLDNFENKLVSEVQAKALSTKDQKSKQLSKISAAKGFGLGLAGGALIGAMALPKIADKKMAGVVLAGLVIIGAGLFIKGKRDEKEIYS